MTALQRAVLDAIDALDEPATHYGIAHRAHKPPTYVRRALEALERQGIVERVVVNRALVWRRLERKSA